MIDARLSLWLSEDKIPHALLFVGETSKISSVALDFAQKAVKGEKKDHHPDIHHVLPEGKTGMHALSTLRSLLNETSLAPYENGRKCFIIYEAERMLPSSANALLKVVEEPPPKTLFIFLTRHKDKILPTLISRMQTLSFSEDKNLKRTPLQETFLSLLFGTEEIDTIIKMLESGKKEREKRLLSDLPQEITPLQREVYEKEIEGAIAMRYQEEFSSLLEIVLDWHRDLCILDCDLPRSYLYFSQSQKRLRHPSWKLIEVAIREAREALERNISAKTILESLLFRLGH